MKRNIKRLLALLLATLLCLSLLPGTAWAADFPSKFYAAITFSSASSSEAFGTVKQSGTALTYTKTGAKTGQVVCGMEYAGGVFFTVEGSHGKGSSQSGDYILSDDGWRELRMYNSDLTNYRTIGEINEKGGGYQIVDTAIDISGGEPALYGTYNTVIPNRIAMTVICTIDLETAAPGNYLQVTGLPDMHILYAIAFDKNGTLYAIGADGAAEGGEATLYTIDLGSASNSKVSATSVDPITDSSGNPISTNFVQDLAFDHATDTLYWIENESEVLYTLDTKNAQATRVGQVKLGNGNTVYPLQSFCIPYDAPFAENKHMISVIYTGGGTVTSGDENKAFYMVEKGGNLTLAITPDESGKLLSVKVDGKSVSVDGLTEYTFKNVTENHVIEATFRENIPITQKNMTWFHYQGYPASFYTQHEHYEFYDLPDLNKEVPREGYTQTLLDENGTAIDNNERITPGDYDVRITHDGTEKYNALNVVFKEALQLAKCPGTPGRPVVYGKVGCTQGDLVTTSYLQDYYHEDGSLTGTGVYDEIPVTLEWQNPDTKYTETGYFFASATIHAATELDQRLKDCYDLDDEGTPLTEGCQIDYRASQVVVLPEDEASIIRLQASDDSGGTVSGKGVYKNDEQVTVTAEANTNNGYEFKGWQEDGKIVSEDAAYEFTTNGDRTLTALFEANDEYRVILKTDPQDGGTVIGGGSYEEDPHQAKVTATANAGYYFIGWYAGDDQMSTENSYSFPVPEKGITLTAKFDIDYLARAEQAKTNFESAVGTPAFEWRSLVQAVDAYETAKTFVENPPSGIKDAEVRFETLTNYYNNVKELDLSNLDINNDDLAELSLFTGVTELNLSGNKGVTSLTGLSHMTKLETLDLSGNTALTNLSGLSSLARLETLNLSGNRGITDLGDLKDLGWLETLDISNTGVTAFDALVKDDGKLALSSLKTLTAKNLSLTSLSSLAELKEESIFWYYIELWDFTGSTLPDTEKNKADVETIMAKLGDKFIPPTIKTTPTGGGGGGGVITYGITVTEAEHGKVTVSPEKAASGSTVTVTATPDNGYELLSLTVTDGNGNELELTDQGSGKYAFTMPASKVEIKAVFRETATEISKPFIDVYESDYYYDTVLWAVDNGITSGVSADLFAPNDSCTRAQIVAFLWRAYGSPSVTGSNPFTDVSADDYYYDAVLWAVKNGVTAGTTDTTFSPGDTCTRAQAVTFQWRAAGSPAATGGIFNDVAADAYYIDAVAWAVANNITVGTGAGNFSPDDICTRAQIVTFLYRELA